MRTLRATIQYVKALKGNYKQRNLKGGTNNVRFSKK